MKSALIANLDKLHTTELGAGRIKRNLALATEDVVTWCAERIKDPHCHIARKGKNWYARIDGIEITVNAHSYTIITAHKVKPEKFDILGRDGNPTGQIANKGTKLRAGQYYLGVHAYIYNSQGAFLLQRRALDKEFLPGGWDIHMGHAVAGETSAECLKREIFEEIGLAIEGDSILPVKRMCWEQYHHMVDIYFLKVDFEIGRLSLQKSEVISVKSVSTGDMLSLVSAMDYRPEEYRRLVTDIIKSLRQ